MKKILVLSFVCLFGVACVESRNKTIEEIEFLLDSGKFDEAITKSRELLVTDANDLDAQKLLASSLLGKTALSGGSGCAETDTGILGLLACLLDAQGADETELETFGRIAPALSQLTDLEEATDIFKTLSQNETIQADEQGKKNVYLKLFLSRMFEIGGAISRIGGNSANTECNNAMPLCPGCIDQVPDDFNASALTPDQETRFREHLSEINSDGQNAGLDVDFSLFERINEISTILGSGALPAFFELSYNTPDKQLCDEQP